MKKKLLIAIMVFAMLALLVACGGESKPAVAPASTPTSGQEEPASGSTPAPEPSASPSAPAAGEPIDVGGPYPATTDWDEYVVVEYYFEETDQTVPMLIETNAGHDKFNVLFDFFGDKQEMTFSVKEGVPTVEHDLTGFIGKDAEKIHAFIGENVPEWSPIG